MRLAVLGSTRGTNMLALVAAIKQQALKAQIDIVISNKKDALILTRARDHQLPATFIDPTGLTRAEYDEKLHAILQEHAIDYVVLTGYMRILSSVLLKNWQHKILNVHPSLLPNFAGLMDLDVHRAVLNANAKETGCTVHYVTENVDAGPIILQKKCAVLTDDTPESLKERVQSLEGVALVEALNKIR